MNKCFLSTVLVRHKNGHLLSFDNTLEKLLRIIQFAQKKFCCFLLNFFFKSWKELITLTEIRFAIIDERIWYWVDQRAYWTSCYFECEPLVCKCKLQYRVVSMHQRSLFSSEPSVTKSAFAIHLALTCFFVFLKSSSWLCSSSDILCAFYLTANTTGFRGFIVNFPS